MTSTTRKTLSPNRLLLRHQSHSTEGFRRCCIRRALGLPIGHREIKFPRKIHTTGHCLRRPPVCQVRSEPTQVTCPCYTAYLDGTFQVRATRESFSNPKEEDFSVFVDSDFCGTWNRATAGSDAMTAKSRSGHVITYAGCPISWSSKCKLR